MTDDGETPVKTVDDLELEAAGYKQELLRGFNGVMSFAFCFTAVGVFSSVVALFGYGLSTGGPAVMTWGWVVTSFFTIIVGAALAEICSSFPSAGSVYHWAGQLAPPRAAPLVSYVTGWLNLLGNLAGDATFAYGFANAVNARKAMTTCPLQLDSLYAALAAANAPAPAPAMGPSNAPSPPMGPPAPPSVTCAYSTQEQVGIAMGITAAWAVMNVTRVDQQGWLNNVAAMWQISSTIAVVAVLLSKVPAHASEHFVWQHGYGPNDLGYVCLIGLLYSCFSFSGYEAGAHMAEETRNARVASAYGLILTCACTAVIGLLLTLGLLYSIPPELGVDTILGTSTAAGLLPANQEVPPNAAFAVFVIACGNKLGMALANLAIVNFFFAGMSSLTVTTRIGFAMARDGAIPGSTLFKRVSAWTKSPVPMVALVALFDMLLLLLPLTTISLQATYGPIAFNAVTSISTIGYQASYAVPLLLRVTYRRNDFPKSDYNNGRLSLPIAWAAFVWLFVTSLFFFWPTSWPVNKYNMNYTVVVVGGFGVLAGGWWVAKARHTYTGPKRADTALSIFELKATATATLAASVAEAGKADALEGE